MTARELERTSPSLEQIYKDIEEANRQHHYKIFYPHYVYFSDACKLELIRQGFKVCQGEWLHGDQGLIIEW